MWNRLKKVTPQTWIAAAMLLLLAAPMYGEHVLRAARRISLVHGYQKSLPGMSGSYQLDLEESYHWCDGSQGRVLVFSPVGNQGNQQRQVVLTDLDYVSQGTYQLDVSGKLAGVSLIPRIHPVVEIVIEDSPNHIRSMHFRLTPHGVEQAYRDQPSIPEELDPAFNDVVKSSSLPGFSS
ncbi:hypothetical protein [Blastopirellula marina]|uniref:Uncharacterized protein n=1 Tax=Blastopirellula marina TaxID=124 RepID=A0A2S8F2N5_9BACT|nr:hypothetical protein [Blastopirellula marina]PQO26432.1 hypothetical protein C5Y98_30300 [Blastopirellula marina]PQO46933.1 hypothetical protein C5Y93_07210 [Blastopirellula marina]PTL40745.1 hypothetical protein C5Y97_30315 [Blastopirellula marina]